MDTPPQQLVINKEMMGTFAAFLITLLIVFYDEIELTKTPMFVAMVMLIFVAGLVIMRDMPGITVIMFFLVMYTMGRLVRRQHVASKESQK